MLIELSKKHSNKVLIEYIEEELSAEEFHSLLSKLLRNYNKWNCADMETLIKPFIKKVERPKGEGVRP